MGRSVHFEIHASDPERFAAFYRAVFDWTIQRWQDQDYWLVTTGPDERPGINGGILPRRGPAPASGAPVAGAVLTSEVTDIDAAIKTALDNGGAVALEKDAMPGVGQIAYLTDPDGNVFGVLQPE